MRIERKAQPTSDQRVTRPSESVLRLWLTMLVSKSAMLVSTSAVLVSASACGGPPAPATAPVPSAPAGGTSGTALPTAAAPASAAPPLTGIPACAEGEQPGPDGSCSPLPASVSTPEGQKAASEPAPVDPPERLSRGTDSASDRELTLGDRAYRDDDLPAARQHYAEAKRLAPKDPAARVGLVRVELLQANVATDYASGQKNPQIARFLREMDEALRFDPNYAPALIERGRLLLILGRAEPALTALKQGLALRSQDPEAHSALGVALLATGDPKNAVQHFEQAAALDPANAERLANLGTAYMMR